tara:strand:+ start:595 stop:780 length:186 start_codon:yes stop_codon:yes gene_type:complete
MITDVTDPKFNITKVPSIDRIDCVDQLCTWRDANVITQAEMLDIACMQWFIQHRVAAKLMP